MKRGDLKSLFEISNHWTRINDEQAVLSAYDPRHKGFWEVVARMDGTYRMRTHPGHYDDDERVYTEGEVLHEANSKLTYAAAKKAARKMLEKILSQIAVEEVLSGNRPTTSKIPSRRELVKLLQNPSPAMQAVQRKMRGLPEADATHPGPRDPRELSVGRYHYKPLLRPASFASVPAGWDYVEAPLEYAPNRRDIPRSKHKYGIIAYNRPLTEEEMEHYSLERMN